jgi:hypothetical protein
MIHRGATGDARFMTDVTGEATVPVATEPLRLRAEITPRALDAISVTYTAPRTLSCRPLFLRWLCLATAGALTLSALALGGFAANANGAPLAVTVLIVVAMLAIVAFAGLLHWRADVTLQVGDLEDVETLRHDAQLVFYSVALFQVLGMIGALLGYREQTRSAGLADGQAAAHALTLALGNGLTATLTGVVCSVVAWVMFLHLQHALDRPS